ncbi:aldehyde dehydrogenase family protein [Clostridium thermarum]|uniref:aldehyde dehydrogenase family protein n=1 Tax=Clostridium thermarum TaxID=1716543 RepID=UPI00111E1CF0|nr:aldehyde dehydrogenase family protein [Clostridium thermarum]
MEKSFEEQVNEMKKVFYIQQQYRFVLKQTSAKERIVKLKRLMKVILENSEAIQEAIYKDFRKPHEESLLTEILPVISSIKYTMRKLSKWMKPKRVKTPISHLGSKSLIRREPRGVSLILSPWNFPFQLAIDPLVYAVAAGNCVILKPSEFSPNTTAIIKRVVESVFEQKEAAVFEGDYRTAERLLELPFDNIFFTGSPAVGKKVMAAAAKNLTTVTLELGGKSPVIIHSSADMEDAAKKIVWGKTVNAGQICVAPDYLFIPREKETEFISLFKKYVNRFYGDMSEKESQKYTSIINKRHFDRIKAMVEDAVKKGASIPVGGDFYEDANIITPTLLTGVPWDSDIMEEEIFGPVLPIIPYDNLDEVYSYINSKPKPLALYVFAKDKRTVKDVMNNTESGDIAVNNVVIHVSNTNLPFGGFNNSGIGKTHGYHGFMAFTHERSVFEQGRINTVETFYPPYKSSTKGLIKRMMKYI